jgi:hypothetical protein
VIEVEEVVKLVVEGEVVVLVEEGEEKVLVEGSKGDDAAVPVDVDKDSVEKSLSSKNEMGLKVLLEPKVSPSFCPNTDPTQIAIKMRGFIVK